MKNKDLSKLRGQIDEIDAKILELYEARMDVCVEVAAYKIESGLQVLDAAREDEKLNKICDMVQNKAYVAGVRDCFEQIISGSRRLQFELISNVGNMKNAPYKEFRAVNDIFCCITNSRRIKVVYQGDRGSYSEAATDNRFGGLADITGVKALAELFKMVSKGDADFAVLPIENSTVGVVTQTFDLMADSGLFIVDTLLLPVRHCLLTYDKDVKISEIKRAYSHPQSFMQCALFFEKNKHIKSVLAENNAFAAKTVVDLKDRAAAAIAPAHAAKVYGLHILQSGIQDMDDNMTKFAVLSKARVYKKEAKKISVCFELPDKSGSLYRCLSHFIYNRLNMTKIESRPKGSQGFEYRFFVDFTGNLGDAAVVNALQGVSAEANGFSVLGNY